MSLLTKLCIINRNYPPEKGATGYHARQLVIALERTGKYDIHIVSAGRNSNDSKRHYIRGWYSGKIKSLRLFSAIAESYRLIKKALSINADFYIVMTDPSFLNFWGSKLFKKRKWAIWTMDIYPDAFVANNLTSYESKIVQYYQQTLRNYTPDYLMALGHHQLDFFRKNYYPNIQATVIPIGLFDESKKAIEQIQEIPEWYEENIMIFGYVGTIGEAHASDAVIRLLKNVSKMGHRCIISCSGAKSQEVLNQVQSLPNVVITDFIAQAHLSFIDIQIVTLLSDWTHICVPSKALSAIQHGSAVFFIGEEMSDTWKYIEKAGWRISEDCDCSEILYNLDTEILNEKKSQAIEATKYLKQKLKSAHQEVDETIQKII